MRVATIRDAGKVLEMIPQDDSPMVIRSTQRLMDDSSVCLIDDEDLAVVAFDWLGTSKWSVHIASHKIARGKYLWEFALQAMLWMTRNRGMRYGFFFVDPKDKAMKRFLGYYKLSASYSLGGDELLYVVTAEQVEAFAAQQQKED